jgi:Chromate transporter
MASQHPVAPPRLRTVAREWGRIGCIGFGGPPTHIALLRDLCVVRRAWLTAEEFADALAVCNLLPGPASTQLAIYCARRVRGQAGAIVGRLSFILPGLAFILAPFSCGAASWSRGSPPGWSVRSSRSPVGRYPTDRVPAHRLAPRTRYCTMSVVTIPNIIPLSSSAWLRMWQWNAHTPFCAAVGLMRTVYRSPGATSTVSAR